MKQLELAGFFPYQLSILQSAVSDSIAQLYAGKFNLSRQEWRVLATLGTKAGISAREVATYTSMEKMPVSRAISRLVKAGLITQTGSREDRRLIILELTPEGRAIYEEIVPLVLEREAFLLSALDETEQEALTDIMDKLLRKTEELKPQ